MKKYLTLACLVILLAVSCQKDDFSESGKGGEINFKVSATIPDKTLTRASDKGGLSNVTDHYLRIIMGVYSVNNSVDPMRIYYQIVDPKTNFSTTPVTFDVTLLAYKYNMVFWADFVEDSHAITNGAVEVKKEDIGNLTDFDKHYNSADLTNITYKGNYIGFDETYDAYTAVEEIDLTSGKADVNVELKRPFGKLRIASADINSTETDNFLPSTIDVTYKQVNTSYNALKATASSMKEIGYNKGLVFGYNNWEDGPDGTKILMFDYLLPNPALEMTIVATENTSKTGQRTISNIPVVANKLTTIKGDVFKSGATLNISVGEEFDEEVVMTIEANSAAEIQEALEKGATSIKFTGQILDDNLDLELSNIYATGTTFSLDIPDAGSKQITLTENSSQGSEYLPVSYQITVGNAEEVTLNVPNGTVSFTGETETLVASTADNTLHIKYGSKIKTLHANKGNIFVWGYIEGLENVVRNEEYTQSGAEIIWYSDERMETMAQAIEFGDGLYWTEEPFWDTSSKAFTRNTNADEGVVNILNNHFTFKGVSPENTIFKGVIKTAYNLTLSDITFQASSPLGDNTTNAVINMTGTGKLIIQNARIVQRTTGTADGVTHSACGINLVDGATDINGCDITLEGKKHIRGINLISTKETGHLYKFANINMQTGSASINENSTYARGINITSDIVGVPFNVDISHTTMKGFYYPLNIESNATHNNITVNYCNFDGYCSINHWGSNSRFMISNSTLTGRNVYTGSSSDFATIVFNTTATGTSITLDNCTVTNIISGTCIQDLIDLRSQGHTVKLQNKTKLIDTSGQLQYAVLDYGWGSANTITKDDTIELIGDKMKGIQEPER